MLTREQRQEIVDDFMARHGGRYDPATFVSEVAATNNHPAHGWFTWDDKAAAGEYRIWEARRFVSGLRVSFTIETIDRGPVAITSAPMVVSPFATRSHGGGYIASASGEGMDALCEEAGKALDSWLRRYGAVLEYIGAKPASLRKLVDRLARADDAA